MSKKLAFKILHMSGCDDGYHAKELEVHSPTTKGWQSSRFCIYPQEIILCLKDPSSVSKIQILSHQYNISSKIEIFISLPTQPGMKSLVGCKFKRLGYVQMSTNEGTNFKARELKSVHLNADGQLVKLLIHKNHVNKLNLYNQVCIVAVNILGHSLAHQYNSDDKINSNKDDLITYYMNQSNHVNNESSLNEAPLPYARYEEGKVISPFDDLAFDMYQDPETAQLIRRLETKKHKAVLEERFDYAKKLKQAIADLYKVGEKLGKFEVDKKRAIEMENYDLAKSKKVQGDEYRLNVYKQLDIVDLLELNKETNANSPNKKKPSNFKEENDDSIQIPTKPYHHSEMKLPPVTQSGMKMVTPVKVESSITIPSISPSRTSPLSQDESVEKNEERPLPALKGKQQPLLVDDEDSPKHDEDIDLPVLGEKEEREFSLIIDVFGMNMAKQLHSKSWKHREESLTLLNTELTNPTEWTTEHTPKELTQAAMTVLKKSLQDQVLVVLNSSITLMKSLLSTYIPQNQKELGKHELSHALERLLPVILKRTGDLVPRSRNLMIDTTIQLANEPGLKDLGIIQNAVSEPIKAKKNAPWRLLKSQIDIMQALIKELGVDKQGGFTTSRIMKVLKAALEHPNNTVRDASVNCILEVYKIVKTPLKSHFPPDEPATRKNPLYVKLFDGFDRADGKLTESERKLAAKKQKEEEEKNKAEEIKALQEQLQNLRSMANAQVESEPGEKNNNQAQLQESTASLKVRNSIKTGGKEPARRESKLRTPIKRDGSKAAGTDKVCIFCGEQNEDFSEEGLDVHYWKSCPMLNRCESCAQVVEISTVREHLVSECEKKNDYMRCKVCHVVVEKSSEKAHLDSAKCKASSDNSEDTVCQLCNTVVPEGDDCWKTHLMEQCKPNRERLQRNKANKPSKENMKTKSVGRVGSRPGGISRGRGRSTSKLPTRTPNKKK